MSKFKHFKRIASGALATAVIALGTSCGVANNTPTTTNQPPVVSTTGTTATTVRVIEPQNPNYPTIEDIKPVYNTDLISEEEIKASTRLNDAIKEMINEDKFFGKNFDYLIESLTITGVRLKGQEVVAPDYAFNADYAPAEPQTTVEIDYIATAVNKTTGEKSTTSNTISYVVEGEEIANMANSEDVDYSDLTNAVADATEEKLDQMADPTLPAPDTTQDVVEGRQSIVTHEFLKTCFNERALELLYETPYLKEYLDNGYTLTSIVESPANKTSVVEYREIGNVVNDKKEKALCAFHFFTPYGIIELQRQGSIAVGSRVITLAENNETGDKKLIMFEPIFLSYDSYDETNFNECLEYLSDYIYVDLDKFHDSLEPDEYMQYIGTTNVAGANVYTEDFYDMIDKMIVKTPYSIIQPITIKKIKIFNVDNPTKQQQEWLNKIANTSNNNILIKTPVVNLEK